ncbi:signal transduction histidine kinase [Solemya velum gill symbiont]|uniref:histidine kinase n=1 Tax=Solemya velum gill symbiont TaxID=2340 RepID=A0A0B0H1K9_SOVGS|nr:ATP-binding protein [Solemya velum gill symbiont]KHF24103.1 signal transduction histidine kinase [Solemya velum gill symbiont]
MVAESINRLKLRAAYAGFLMLVLLVTLHLMSNAVQNSATLSKLYIPLLIVSVSGLFILLGLVFLNLYRLFRSYRNGVPGARMTVRMVSFFTTLSLIPVLVVFYYSMQFLRQGIDSWFDIEIETIMSDALTLGKASLNLEKSRLLNQTRAISRELVAVADGKLLGQIGRLHGLSGATELTLMDENGLVILSRNQDPSVVVADTPGTSILQQVRESGSFVGIIPYGIDEQLHLRIVVADLAAKRVVQALFPTSERVTLLSEKVEESYEEYLQLTYLREQLQFGFTITLVLVLLFAVFGALWGAIYSARRLLSPIVNLAEATEQVAAGDYSTRLPHVSHSDELGFLVSSFNQMTRRISQARDEAANSQRQVESQRTYLQTLLEHLTTGVLTFDCDRKLRTANSAASTILDVQMERCLEMTLDEIAAGETRLAAFFSAVYGAGLEREHQVVIDTGTGYKTLRWQVTPLASECGDDGGIVLMFDDVTDLIQAQRDAAWSEVARRLAHEIKNPLTPIQLSAERIRRKYMPLLEEEQKDVLDRATHTIVQQVDAMKQMVNAFSDYAKPSNIDMQARPLEFDNLLREVVTLYSSSPTCRVTADYGAGSALMHADPVKMRQVFHNLLKNAQEAVAGLDDGCVEINSATVDGDGYHYIELMVTDNGSGFDADLMERIFDPYVTTKEGGTGLGLAIVKKIVEEHNGGIWLVNRRKQGARAIVRLPVWQEGDVYDAVPAPDHSVV